jgi:hypothetical protein
VDRLNTTSKLRTIFSFFEEKLHPQKATNGFHTELTGKWTVYQPNQQKTLPLEITPEGQGQFNHQPVKGEMSHSSADQLVMKDRYGYRLTIQKQDDDEYVLYDELGEVKWFYNI